MTRMMTWSARVAALIVALVAVAAQAQPMDPWRGVPAMPDPAREWTIFVYLVADNDLEAQGLADIKEMERGLPTRGVDVLVLIDRAKGYDRRFGDWTGARLLRVRRSDRNDIIGSETLADLGEIDMGTPETLRAFVEGGLKRFAARRHAVVMWDHGSGWASMGSDHDSPGARDGRSRLTTADMGAALGDAVRAAGIGKLDLIGFDMCLMSQLETAVEIGETGRMMVASQALEPGEGWPYDRVLGEFADPTRSTSAIAQEVVKRYAAHYVEARDPMATQSAIDLERIEPLRRALDVFARKLVAATPQSWSPLSRAIFFAQAYFPRTDFRKGRNAVSSIDLIDLATRVRRLMPGVADAEADALAAAAKAAVIGSSTTPLYRFSQGLSLYAPVTQQQYDGNYAGTRLARTTAWPAALRALHEAQAASLRAPRVAALSAVRLSDGAPIRSADIGGGYGIRATIEGHNVLWVEMLQGQFHEGTGEMLVLSKGYMSDPQMVSRRREDFADLVDFAMPQLDNERNEVVSEFVGNRIVIGNGEQYGAVTVDATDLSDLEHFSIRAVFDRPEVGQHVATVKFNLLSLRAVSAVAELPQENGRIAYRQFRPSPNDAVTLLMESLRTDGTRGEARGATIRWGRGLDAKLINDQPGEVAVAVRPESIGGASAFHLITLRAKPMTPTAIDGEQRAKRIQVADLLGVWDWYVSGANGMEPMGQSMTVTAEGGALRYSLQKEARGRSAATPPHVGALEFDTMFTPHLRLLTLDAQRELVGADSFIMRVIASPDGMPLITLKYIHPAGLLFAITRREGTGMASASGAFAPGPPGGPAPTAPALAPALAALPSLQLLLGRWRSIDGAVLWFTDSRYAIYQSNQLVESGAYAVQGDFLYLARPNGAHDVMGLSIQGAALYLRDAAGRLYGYARAP